MDSYVQAGLERVIIVSFVFPDGMTDTFELSPKLLCWGRIQAWATPLCFVPDVGTHDTAPRNPCMLRLLGISDTRSLELGITWLVTSSTCL